VKIVVLDGRTLDPDLQAWAGLCQLGDVVVHEFSTAEEVPVRAAGAAVLVTNKSPIRKDLIAILLELRFITITATGFDCVDLGAARRRGIPAEAVTWCKLDELFARSDVISLHCPLTDQTAGMVNRDRLGRVRPTAFLINTARGGLVIEDHLAEALNAGRLAGAALDVVSREPIKPDNPLLGARNCLITPHIAWAASEARGCLMEATVANVSAFLAGHPINVVN